MNPEQYIEVSNASAEQRFMAIASHARTPLFLSTSPTTGCHNRILFTNCFASIDELVRAVGRVTITTSLVLAYVHNSQSRVVSDARDL